MEQIQVRDTIAAISTPPGVGGIAVIRVSGPQALSIVNSAWKGADLSSVSSHTIHLGKYISTDGNLLDEAVASVFISPASFTGEDIVEISVHGSTWIQREILNDLVKRGARIADPGEFTKRAFLNGKLDLAQAEGVADLIASSSKAAHDLAITQTKGTFSKEFDLLRERLIEFASLLELELDFSEEDVEFADRTKLLQLCDEILRKVKRLADSYAKGAVLKNGVPVVIAGIPNAGKSSLLNLLLNDDKAIVTDTPGTTRDIIEDTIEIDGILYRFIDTAGLRETSDTVEAIGVERAYSVLSKAYIVIWVLDPTSDMDSQIRSLQDFKTKYPQKNLIILLNKSDISSCDEALRDFTIPVNSPCEEPLRGLDSHKGAINKPLSHPPHLDLLNQQSVRVNTFSNSASGLQNLIPFSTKTSDGLPELLSTLHSIATQDSNPQTDILVTNARHYEALTRADDSLERVMKGLQDGISGDFIAQDIREATAHLATITGSITTDNLLHSIFSRFCIGK